MNIKRAFAGFLSAILISACGIEFFKDSKEVKAVEFKNTYISKETELIFSFYDDITVIEVLRCSKKKAPKDCICISYDEKMTAPLRYKVDTWTLGDGYGGYNCYIMSGQGKLIFAEDHYNDIYIDGIPISSFKSKDSDIFIFDLDENGTLNILDTQMLLTYILEVQMESYEYSDEGFYQFKEDYLNEREVINE